MNIQSNIIFTQSILFNEKNHQIPMKYNSEDIKCLYFNDVDIEEYSVM